MREVVQFFSNYGEWEVFLVVVLASAFMEREKASFSAAYFHIQSLVLGQRQILHTGWVLT